MASLRGDIKYYFADFVRNGGTPPLFTDKICIKSYGFEGSTPPSPLRTFPKKMSSKRAENCVFLPKEDT